MNINIEDKIIRNEGVDIDPNQGQSFSFRDTLKTLDGGGERFKNRILELYPKLATIKDQLWFDEYSKIKNIDPFLIDLSSLPQSTLEKIRKYDNLICISDRPVTIRSSNKDLKGRPRGWPEGSSRENVGGIYRKEHKTLYVGIGKTKGHIEAKDSTLLHELGHMFDYESVGGVGATSQTQEFKNYHKLFYDKLISYCQQGGPGGEVGCKEFFAELCYQYFRWGKEKFSQYYNEDLHNFMGKILE